MICEITWKRLWAALFCAIIFIGPSAAAAERLPSEQTRDKAIARLVEQTKAKPKDVGAWHDLAALYREDKNWDAAINAENKAISLHDKYAVAFLGRGLAEFAKKEFEAARRDFTKAAELWQGAQSLDEFLKLQEANPDHVDAYKMRSRSWAEEGKWTEAITDLTIAVRLRKQDAHLYLERAGLREKAVLIPEAISDYRLSALLFMDRGDVTNAEETAKNLERLRALQELKEVTDRIQEKKSAQTQPNP